MSSRSLFRTLIRRESRSIGWRRISTEAYYMEVSLSESNIVEKIEDAIHRNIVRRSQPDWLPFLPGSSYWVPPRRPSYGVADMVDKLTNPLDHDQAMSLTTFHGWPSSHFYIHNHVQVSSSDAVEDSAEEAKTSSTVIKEETSEM